MARHLACWFALIVAVAANAAGEPPADHWAWRTPARPAVPDVDRAGPPVLNPIDRLILNRLESVGLSPAPPADRPTLIRRATYDLTGLPPTPKAVAAFVADTAPDAWEKVVDRLLASPAYGERWGRHWLDLARYADSNGFEHDEVRPDAWRYRDYVVRSFNADKPYDRFVTEQLAGDEAFPDDADARIATGFNLLGPDMTDASDQGQRRLNTLADMTDTAGLVFLGLTVGCARCHDHKTDPLPQADYYRLLAVFAPAAFHHDLDVARPAERAAHDAAAHEYDALTRTLREEIEAIEGPVRNRLFEAKLGKLSPEAQAAHRTPPARRTGGQQELVAETARKVVVAPAAIEKALAAADRERLLGLRNRLAAFDGRKPVPLPVAMGLGDAAGPPSKTFVLERGELSNRGDEVSPGFPAMLTPASMPPAGGSGRRLALARWLVNPDNPLAARVIVNRLWQHHFGRGLVGTPSDFGRRDEPPTHPKLLDWLATDLAANGWRLKPLHRLMLLSATYRQSSAVSPEAATADPDNRLLSRMNRRRLEGEAVRDAMLAVSGRLEATMGGPGVGTPTGKGAKSAAEPRDLSRRSIYLFARRNVRDSFLEAFDLPDSNLSCARRERSTTAPQALALLNAADVMTAAQAWAERLSREAPTDDERIDRAYRVTLGRPPSAIERDRSAAFLRDSPLSELCRALFNLNEFVYLD